MCDQTQTIESIRLDMAYFELKIKYTYQAIGDKWNQPRLCQMLRRDVDEYVELYESLEARLAEALKPAEDTAPRPRSLYEELAEIPDGVTVSQSTMVMRPHEWIGPLEAAGRLEKGGTVV